MVEPVHRCGVLILGGGIGGLSAAHRLVTGGYKGSIVILERNEEVGGIARSGVVPEYDMDGQHRPGAGLPTEYSWRVGGTDYAVANSIWKDIPLRGEEITCAAENLECQTARLSGRLPLPHNQTKPLTVADNWVPLYDPYWISMQDGRSVRPADANIWSLREYARAFGSKLSRAEIFTLINKFAYALSCSRLRLERELAKTTWARFMSPVPPAAEPFVIRAIAPIFGVDMYASSAAAVSEYVELWLTGGGHGGPQHTVVGNQPTSDAWFKPWQRFLQEHGVQFHLKSSVISLNVPNEQSRGKKCELKSVDVEMPVDEYASRLRKRFVADWYVCALPIESLVCLLPKGMPEKEQYRLLSRRTRQEMVGVQIYWDQEIVFAQPHSGVLLLDSPWQLIMESQGAMWGPNVKNNTGSSDKTFIESQYTDRVPAESEEDFVSEDDFYANQEVNADFYANQEGNGRRNTRSAREKTKAKTKDIWTVTLCDQHRPGIGVKRPWTQCTRAEIEKEVMVQLRACKVMQRSFRGRDGTPFVNLVPVAVEVWDSYQIPSWNPALPNQICGRDALENEQVTLPPSALNSCSPFSESVQLSQTGPPLLKTWEPKASPNACTEELEPETNESPFSNMLLSAVWAKRPRRMYKMERAASNGFAAAEHILNTKPENGLFVGAGSSSGVRKHRKHARRAFQLVLAPARFLDHVFCLLSLPHPEFLFPGKSISLWLISFFIIVALLVCFVGVLGGVVASHFDL